MMEEIYKWLNAFPSKGSKLSSTISPATIVEGRRKPDFSYKRISFGSYAVAYKGTKNNMTGRGIPAIALRESNDAGGYYFMSLETGERLHCHIWTEEPIDDYIINRVDELDVAEDQPIMTNGYPIFEWAPGIPINGNDDVEPDSASEDMEIEFFDDQFDDESDHDNDDDENNEDKHDHEDFDHDNLQENNVITEESDFDEGENDTDESTQGCEYREPNEQDVEHKENI